MSTKEDLMLEMAAHAQATFIERALGNPAELTKHDFEEIRDCLPEIIKAAKKDYKLPAYKIATHLVALRNFAAFSDVEITLTPEMTRFAEANWGPQIEDAPSMDHLTEAEAFGILAHSRVQRQKS